MNPRLEKVLNLPGYQRVLIVLLVMAALAAGFYFLFYQPQLERQASLIQKRDTAAVQLRKNQKIAGNLAAYKAEYEKMQVKLKEALAELPLEREIPTLLTGVADLAKEKGLEVLRFKPSGEVVKGFYAEVPVELQLSGSYHQAGAFFDAVSKMKRIVNIQNLTMGGAKEVDGRMALNIGTRALTYRFVDNPPEQKGKQKGGQ
jgi:type IV pilus assembly protein PilO